MENKWTFAASFNYQGQNIGIWIRPVPKKEDPSKFEFESSTQEMTLEEIQKAEEEYGITYAYRKIE